MPWNSNQGGGGGGGPWGGGRGPWGQPPGGGQQPPNLEELLRKGQDRFRGILPSGNWGGRGVAIAILLVIAFWAVSGVYRVGADEQGVVLRFGKYVATTGPGLHITFPPPIGAVETPKVTRENQINIGFVTTSAIGRTVASRNLTEESLMLTGDENIVDIHFAVVWIISDAGKYLFNVRNPEGTVKAVSESAMREVVGRMRIDDVLTEGREQLQNDTHQLIQSTLDAYNAGVEIVRVNLQKSDPPAAVIDAFRDVQAARADQERLRNEAQAYANDIIPRARGEAEQIRLDAEGYREQVVAQAQGEVSRFLAIFKEYSVAKDVTRRRIYLETMEDVLSGMTKIIIDGEKGPGVVPYLPLDRLQSRPAPPAPPRPAAPPEGRG
jgi:membrane protease subunit HflK